MTASPTDWGAVAETHATRIWAVAREVAPDDDAAWDCVQEAFLTGLRSPRGPEGDPVRWLCGVAKNHARHMTRTRRRWLDLVGRFSRRASPPAREQGEGKRADLTAALARLPARERDAILLRYLGGMSVREVAAAQRVSEAAAKSRLRRGLSRLRTTLGPALLVLLLVRAAAVSPDPLGQLAGALATGGPLGLPVAVGAVVLAAVGFLAPGLLRETAAPDEPVATTGVSPVPIGEDGPVAAPSGDAAREWVYFESRETARGPFLNVLSRGGKEQVIPVGADTVLISYLANIAYGAHHRLSVTLGDQTRVLVRFPTKGLRPNLRKAELALHLRWSRAPPSEAIKVAVHRVTEAWNEAGACWGQQPAFAEEPEFIATIGPEEGEVRLDVTGTVKSWLARKQENHGLLIKIAKPLDVTAPVPAPPAGDWTQPEIRTGTPFSDTLPWARDLEEAVARAAREKKLVLATVVPIGGRRWVSGFRGAEMVWKGLGPHPWGDARAMAIDAGLVKERAMMASLFTDPEIVHLVGAHFVPVRVRPYTLSFDEGGVRRYPDPLGAIGISARDVGGPALVFARPDGTLVHGCRRMGVFSVPMVRGMIRAVLEKAEVEPVAYERPPRSPKLEKAWEFARAGKHAKASVALRGLRHITPEAAYLLGHLEDRAGEVTRARGLWESAVRRDRSGPWGSKAAVRLMRRQGRLEEWESLEEFPFDPLAECTEIDARERPISEVLERAVDVLLLAQRADGSWRDPFVDVSSLSGPGSQYDKAVPRTGLVVDALMRMRPRLPRRREDLEEAIARGTAYVGRFADVPAPHVWKLTYALHLQVAILSSDATDELKESARRRARTLVASLGTIQQDGGWSYMPPPRTHSFNTAPVLLLLEECRRLGVAVPRAVMARAAKFLEGLRRKDDPRDFAYASSLYHGSVRASSCRTALCELALQAYAGTKDVSRLRAAVDLFFEHEAVVRDTTKVFESYFSPTALHDSYHYYFGHYYAARALEHLPAKEAKRYAARQKEIILRQVELDGSFVDAQMQGKTYSTAMALLTLMADLEAEAR